ncbi:MAG: heavy-metal-associated domain-containing protein [Ignavibacteria bacterium]|nr:heavy-metal-associated domain-containing protein [Ignavibacteriota bacterium]
MKNQNLRNTFLSLLTILLITVLIGGCGSKESGDVSGDTKKTETIKENSETMNKDKMTNHSNMEHADITLGSMQCGMCKKTIETAVKNSDGVNSINVDKNEKMAHIDFDKNKTDITKIEAIITAAGYDANQMKADPKGYKNLSDCCKLPEDRKE